MYSEETNHHRTLGVPAGATPDEIKAAYRRLARQYHPDVNPDPGAKEKFQQLSAAYQYLTKTSAGDAFAQVFSGYEEQEDQRKVWREAQKAKRAQQKKEKAVYKQYLLQKVYRVSNIIVGFYMLFTGLLVLDYILPAREYAEEVEQVVHVYSSRGRSRTGAHLQDDIYFKNFKLHVAKEQGVSCCGGAVVHATPMFRTVLKAELEQQQGPVIAKPAYGFYHFFGFLIPLALLLGFLYFRLPPTKDLKLSVGFVLLFMALFHFILFLFLRK